MTIIEFKSDLVDFLFYFTQLKKKFIEKIEILEN